MGIDLLAFELEIFKNIWRVISISWWAILPLGLFFVWKGFWVWGLNRMWKKSIEWVMLEIKIPRNILKTPKAMENIFSALHAVYATEMTFEDRYLSGTDLSWFTFELVGYAGGVHFYVRCTKRHRNLIESAIYSEYPDAEFAEAEDYTGLLPDVLPNEVYDLWGNDYVLSKESPYPIRTYEFFEAQVEEQRLDPLAAITEVMSRLKEGEAIWLQYLIRPVSDYWKKEGEEIRDKIMQRKKEKPAGILESLIKEFFIFLRNLTIAPTEVPTWPGGEKKEEKFKILALSPGEKNILEGVENKISKLGFETAIRFIYIDRQDSFSPANVAAVQGAFKQFSTQDMNKLGLISETVTFVTSKKLTTKSWFRRQKLHYRKRLIYDMYKLRWFPPKFSILNTEELATIFHFPLVTVEAPLLRRLETRKGEPPGNLPIR
ncbi:MAG: hypothetical protein HZB99_02845 [Candidatus Harrisonbacteria bacterium]|nr:hypothetical protein [Candidatus Harrisonbacteria bacterium]